MLPITNYQIRNSWRCPTLMLLMVVLSGPFPASLPVASAGSQFVSEAWMQDSVQVEEVGETQEQAAEPEISQRSPEFILQYQGIEPTGESLLDYLQRLQPDHPSQKENTRVAVDWITKLGSEHYHERMEARQQLSMMPTLPLIELHRARQSADPEVRASAAMILQYSKNRAPKDSIDGITRAVCKTIVEKKVPGLAEALLAAMPLFEDEATTRAFQAAVRVSATQTDIDLLMARAAEAGQAVRIAAMAGLVEVLKADSVSRLEEWIHDPDPTVRLFVCRELANFGERQSLEPLLELMEAEDLVIRQGSNKVLRALTGKTFRFFAFEKPEQRQAALERWRQWLANEGQSATLHFPLVDLKVEVGRILLSDYSAGKIVELDLDGKVTWEKSVTHPWAVKGLTNGNRLVGLYEPSSIVEFDAEGKEVLKIEGVPGNVMGIDYFDGRILAACSSADKIVEYDREGKIVWEQAMAGRPTDAEYLENGNLLITVMEPPRVVEITRDGEEVWDLDAAGSTMQAQRTERGTTVYVNTEQSAVLEFDLDGNEISRLEFAAGIVAAREMSNGDLLVSTTNSVIRRKRDGTQVWEYDNLTYCYNIIPF